MFVLAFDTTSERGGVGIFRNRERLALVPNAGPANFYSISLFQMVEQALSQAQLRLGEIDLYAVANGPGSFTGIRVGLAAARGWGRALSKPARGVSTLEALANKLPLTSDWAFPILDARRGEFFLGAFRRTLQEGCYGRGGRYSLADGGWVLKPAEVGRFLEERIVSGVHATCVVRAHDQAALALADDFGRNLDWQRVEGTLVDAIAALAVEAEKEGRMCAASSLDACYIRRPDAEIAWKG